MMKLFFILNFFIIIINYSAEPTVHSIKALVKINYSIMLGLS